MDFAEFSDIETMGFATYRQKLQKQFSKDVERGIIQAHTERCNSDSSVKIIPIIGNAVALGDALFERYRLRNKELPDETSQSIFTHATTKFNETLKHIGSYVNVIQGKLSTSQKEIEAKQEVINSLTAELNQMKEAFLSDEAPVANKDLEIRRLKHKITILTTQNKILTNSVKDLKEKQHQRYLSDERTKKAKVIDRSAKIDELHEIINQLNRRNLQLQERMKNKKKEIEDWNLSDYLADAIGFKDVFDSLKKFFWGIENIYKAVVILGYAYTFHNSVHFYLKWLNTWNNPWHKLYALSIFPFMVFCMIKLGKF